MKFRKRVSDHEKEGQKGQVIVSTMDQMLEVEVENPSGEIKDFSVKRFAFRQEFITFETTVFP